MKRIADFHRENYEEIQVRRTALDTRDVVVDQIKDYHVISEIRPGFPRHVKHAFKPRARSIRHGRQLYHSTIQGTKHGR